MIAICTLLAIALDHGILLNSENHAGLLPVVRRILDPNYLPGDFGISIRIHHHHAFTWLVAMLSLIFGENGALELLTVLGYVVLFAGIWRLGGALELAPARRLMLGVALASSALFLDHGVEANRFLGNGPIMPPTFAHAIIVFCIEAIVRQRWNLAFALAGAAALLHLQIGGVWMLVLVATALHAGVWRQPRRYVPGLVAGAIIMSPALVDAWALLRHGLISGIGTMRDIALRMPQHFEFYANRVAALALYFGLFVWLWRRWRATADDRAARFRPLLCISTCLVVLTAVHYLDYYVVKTGWLSRLQLLRLSVFIPVLSAFALIAAPAAKPGGRERWPLALAAVFAIAALGTQWVKHEPPSLGIADQAQANTDWGDVTRWIRDDGPQGLYLTPPGQIGFTAYTNRSTVVEFKINPDGGAGLAQWEQRLRDVTGVPLPPGSTRRGVAAELDRAYARLSQDDVRKLRHDYGVRTAVVPSVSTLQGHLLYRNSGYRVIALKD
ncbi:MAG: DUF6798 domain-containing protein [Rudaea sp.]